MKLFNINIDLVNRWTRKNLSGLFITNLIVIIMVLLSNAGYFRPYLFLGINVIIFVTLILSIILLYSRSRTMFLISVFFWIFSCLLKIVKVDVWAERSAIYAFQSMFLGIILTTFNK
jgi:hypothetical protein